MKTPSLDFRKARVTKGREFPIPSIERVRAARGVPQAVVKITSFGRGPRGTKGILSYISRKGELPLETETGDQVIGLDQQKSLVEDWSPSFDRRHRSRDVAHITFSFPRGSDPVKLRNAVRTVIVRHFSGHKAAFGIHEDTAHPHAHVALTMKNQRDGHKLRLRKSDLHRLREVFAEAAREEGVPLAASSRAARGVGRKADSYIVRRVRSKGGVPIAEQETRKDVLNQMERGSSQTRPWERAIAERHKKERQSYFDEAKLFRESAQKERGHLRESLLKAAIDLEKFARSMPMPQTLHQLLQENLKAFIRSKRRSSRSGRLSGGWER